MYFLLLNLFKISHNVPSWTEVSHFDLIKYIKVLLILWPLAWEDVTCYKVLPTVLIFTTKRKYKATKSHDSEAGARFGNLLVASLNLSVGAWSNTANAFLSSESARLHWFSAYPEK